jgi:hypothetical protein
VWDAGIDDYYAEYDEIGLDADARGPAYLHIGEEERGTPAGAEEETSARIRRVTQTLKDPEGDRDWVIEAIVDCDASDEAGDLVLAATAMRALTGG